MTISLDRRR